MGRRLGATKEEPGGVDGWGTGHGTRLGGAEVAATAPAGRPAAALGLVARLATIALGAGLVIALAGIVVRVMERGVLENGIDATAAALAILVVRAITSRQSASIAVAADSDVTWG